MADPRFHNRAGPFPLSLLAERCGGRLGDPGDADFEIVDVAALDAAASGEISFFADRRYLARFKASGASAVVIATEIASLAPDGTRLILSESPYRTFARIAQLFYPKPPLVPGIAPSAVIAEDAVIGEGCRIEAGAVIKSRAEIGPRCHIQEHAVIGEAVRIGADGDIGAGVTVSHALIGDRVQLKPGARIGQPGFGFAHGPEGVTKLLQLGRVIIGHDVEIGSNTTIDRGASGDTEIGDGTMIDNLVQIGHNVVLGRGCILAGQAGVSGSTKIGDYVMIGGQGGVAGHLTIGNFARVSAQSGVMRDLPEKVTVGGSPAVPSKQWLRQTAALERLAKGKGD